MIITGVILGVALLLGAACRAIIVGRNPALPYLSDYLWPWFLVRWGYRKVRGDMLAGRK